MREELLSINSDESKNNNVINFDKLSKNNIDEAYRDLLNEIGLEGKYQKILSILFCLTTLFCCLILTSMPVQKEYPSHSCISREELNSTKYNYIINNKEQFKIYDDQKCISKLCSRNQILIVDFYSIRNFITELDIVCDFEDFYLRSTQMIFFGRIVGNIIFSYISDKFGRFKSYKIQFYLLLGSYITMLLIKNQFVYLLVCFVTSGCFNIYNLASAMSTETMNLSMYSLVNGLIGAFYSLSGFLNIFVLYFFHNFPYLIMMNILIGCIVGYLMINYMTETPHFLLAKKNYYQLNNVIVKIAEINETLDNKEVKRKFKAINNFLISQKFNSDNLTQVENFEIKEILGPYKTAFRSKTTTFTFIKLMIPFAAMFVIYFGQALNVEKMNGSIYFNSLMIYSGEIIAEISSGIFLKLYKRKFLMIGAYACSFVLLLFMITLYFFKIFAFLQTILLLANTFFISVLFTVLYVYAAEIFDTSVKSTMISVLVNFSNLLLLFSPYMIDSFSSPLILFAIFSGLGAFNSYFLIETKND
jgi:MFS family permease